MDYSTVAVQFMETISRNHHTASINAFQKFTKGEIFALSYILHRKDSALAGDLSAAMHTSSARTATLLNSLEDKGYVRRLSDEKDKRKVLISITDAGRELILSKHKIMKENLVKTFEAMGEEDTNEFLRLLKIFFAISSEIVSSSKSL